MTKQTRTRIGLSQTARTVLVLSAIKKHQPITRAEIAKELQLKPMLIDRAISDLKAKNMIHRVGHEYSITTQQVLEPGTWKVVEVPKPETKRYDSLERAVFKVLVFTTLLTTLAILARHVGA